MCVCTCVYACAERSLQQHPEVNKATRKRWSDWRQAERTSSFYIIALLARQYLQAGHKVFVHVLFASPPVRVRPDTRAPCTKRGSCPLIRPKVAERGGGRKKRSSPKSEIWRGWHGGGDAALRLGRFDLNAPRPRPRSSPPRRRSCRSPRLVRFRAVFAGHGCCGKCQFFYELGRPGYSNLQFAVNNHSCS